MGYIITEIDFVFLKKKIILLVGFLVYNVNKKCLNFVKAKIEDKNYIKSVFIVFGSYCSYCY